MRAASKRYILQWNESVNRCLVYQGVSYQFGQHKAVPSDLGTFEQTDQVEVMAYNAERSCWSCRVFEKMDAS